MRGIWVVWNNREQDPKNYKNFKEIYLSITFDNKYLPKNDKEVFDYCKKIKQANKIPYIVIVSGYITDKEYLNRVRKYSKEANIMLDYIRYIKSDYKNIFKTKQITNRVKLAKEYCDKNNKKLKLAVFLFPNAFFVGQNYFSLKRLGTICPMIYPEDCFKGNGKKENILTWIALYFHRLLFPKCEPIIQAWHRKTEYLKKDMQILKDNYSIFRWIFYKKIK